MKMAASALPETVNVVPALPAVRGRLADYLELTKPRIAVLVLFTVAAGYFLAARGRVDLATLTHAIFGAALLAAGASALNQLLERDTDALMRRTEARPLPAGRMQATEVLIFGLALIALGLLWLAAFTRQPAAVLVGALTAISYVGLYTPLKRKTSLNTLVGAVPGALPPVIGWAAAGGGFGSEPMALFLILFLWQVPHFLAIAWLYREDYARAGLRMLPGEERDGSMTSRQMVSYCLALVPASLLPVARGMAGGRYAAAAVLLSLVFVFCALGFARRPSDGSARRVLRASLLYLPALLAALVVDGTVYLGP